MHIMNLSDISKINIGIKVAIIAIVSEGKVLTLKILRQKKKLRKSLIFSSKTFQKIFEIYRIRALYLIQCSGGLFLVQQLFFVLDLYFVNLRVP